MGICIKWYTEMTFFLNLTTNTQINKINLFALFSHAHSHICIKFLWKKYIQWHLKSADIINPDRSHKLLWMWHTASYHPRFNIPLKVVSVMWRPWFSMTEVKNDLWGITNTFPVITYQHGCCKRTRKPIYIWWVGLASKRLWALLQRGCSEECPLFMFFEQKRER